MKTVVNTDRQRCAAAAAGRHSDNRLRVPVGYTVLSRGPAAGAGASDGTEPGARQATHGFNAKARLANAARARRGSYFSGPRWPPPRPGNFFGSSLTLAAFLGPPLEQLIAAAESPIAHRAPQLSPKAQVGSG